MWILIKPFCPFSPKERRQCPHLKPTVASVLDTVIQYWVRSYSEGFRIFYFFLKIKGKALSKSRKRGKNTVGISFGAIFLKPDFF